MFVNRSSYFDKNPDSDSMHTDPRYSHIPLPEMPSTATALTPGLSSFLKSLKTNPIDTSIENLVSYASLALFGQRP
jgi:hypothetical protein